MVGYMSIDNRYAPPAQANQHDAGQLTLNGIKDPRQPRAFDSYGIGPAMRRNPRKKEGSITGAIDSSASHRVIKFLK